MSEAPRVVGEVIRLSIDSIEIPENRVRPIEMAWAQVLSGMMNRDGQQTPIEVLQLPGKKTYRLVAGAHRIVGAKLLGWAEIDAIKTSNDGKTARLREIQNLARRELGPLDFASSIADLYGLLKADSGLAPDQSSNIASARARWGTKEEAFDASAKFAHAYGWADEVAAKAGFSRRTIYNAIALHRKLTPQLAAAVRGTQAERNASQLADLSDLTPAQQLKVAEALQAGQPLEQALLAIVGKKPTLSSAEKAQSALLSSLQRMSVKQQKVALGEFAKVAENHGWRITFERIGK